jgi:alkanesulfonate monooxygenase SsuD/methylene tetrahydromethanopterin reductase-like flavin-dependent oxidoreductase (luciferase family)
METMNFGITLSNRAVTLGLCSARDLLALADAVEACPELDSVWCGDALFVNRRLDAVTLLAAVAGRTDRVLLGPACMGSFALRNPLVFAYEWASLDVLSNGRTRLVVCAGGGGAAA